MIIRQRTDKIWIQSRGPADCRFVLNTGVLNLIASGRHRVKACHNHPLRFRHSWGVTVRQTLTEADALHSRERVRLPV